MYFNAELPQHNAAPLGRNAHPSGVENWAGGVLYEAYKKRNQNPRGDASRTETL
jgi:hypothetical protein